MLTFKQMQDALRVASDDPKEWKYKSRGVILGKMHAYKKDFWKYFTENCPHQEEPEGPPRPPTRKQLLQWIHEMLGPTAHLKHQFHPVKVQRTFELHGTRVLLILSRLEYPMALLALRIDVSNSETVWIASGIGWMRAVLALHAKMCRDYRERKRL